MEKAKQIYNGTQPVKLKELKIIPYYDEKYFKENKIDKNLKTLSKSEKKHFRFNMPSSAFAKKIINKESYTFK